MRYRVHVRAEATQVVDVEADSVEAAIEQALDEQDLYANVSNRFDMGDPEAYVVYDDDRDEVVWEDK